MKKSNVESMEAEVRRLNNLIAKEKRRNYISEFIEAAKGKAVICEDDIYSELKPETNKQMDSLWLSGVKLVGGERRFPEFIEGHSGGGMHSSYVKSLIELGKLKIINDPSIFEKIAIKKLDSYRSTQIRFLDIVHWPGHRYKEYDCSEWKKMKPADLVKEVMDGFDGCLFVKRDEYYAKYVIPNVATMRGGKFILQFTKLRIDVCDERATKLPDIIETPPEMVIVNPYDSRLDARLARKMATYINETLKSDSFGGSVRNCYRTEPWDTLVAYADRSGSAAKEEQVKFLEQLEQVKKRIAGA